MKKLIIASLVLVSYVKAQRLDNNTLIHYSVGIGVGNGLGIFAKNPEHRFFVGLAGGFVVGLGKELYDSQIKKNQTQFHDIVATALGGATGAMMTNWAIKRAINRKSRERLEKCKM